MNLLKALKPAEILSIKEYGKPGSFYRVMNGETTVKLEVSGKWRCNRAVKIRSFYSNYNQFSI
jgi:hypothetical protein